MPHCLIEYSSELFDKLEPSLLVKAVYRGALSSELFESKQIKIRAQSFEYYLVGEERNDFIHVTVSILSGRTAEQKSNLANQVLSALISLDMSNVSLTVDIRDLNRDCYAKAIT